MIVANLVGNALRYGNQPVTIRLHTSASWLVTEVADRGPGIPPRKLAHVFDRFFKADPAGTRSAGRGLGLAIARRTYDCTAAQCGPRTTPTAVPY
jgi:two-component system sensor histidine kinase MtrB